MFFIYIYIYIYIMYNNLGFVANGEFNEFRGMGYTRPLSILRIRANARTKYSKMSKKILVQMMTVQTSK